MIDPALESAATAAGILDLGDLALLPDSDAPPAERMAAFKASKPACFRKQVDAMTREELAAFEMEHFWPKHPKPAGVGKHVREMTNAELTAYERTVGIRPSHTEMLRREAEDARRFGR